MAPSGVSACETDPVPHPSGTVQLLLRNMDSRTTVLRLRPWDTLDTVLHHLGEAIVRRGELRVTFGGRELPRRAMISDLHLPPDAMLHCFLNTVKPLDKKKSFGSTGAVAEYLDVFLQSGAAKVLVHFYLSSYVPHRVAADQAIRCFLHPDTRTRPNIVKVWTAPVLMELCRLIAAGAGRGDLLYMDLRGTLATVLSMPSWTPPRSPDLPPEWVAKQVCPFAKEMAQKVMADITRGNRNSVVLDRNLFEFNSFWSVMRRWVCELSVGSASPSESPWMTWLSMALMTMVRFLDGHMEQIETGLQHWRWRASSSATAATPRWTTSLHSVWTVLAELDAWSELNAFRELCCKVRAMLLAHKTAVTSLVVSVGREWIGNIRWIAKHRDLLAFEARMHLALTMLPVLGDGIDAPPRHEVLIDRSRLMDESFGYITLAAHERLHAGLVVEFKHEQATGPGVMREWFCLVCRELFNPRIPLFLACPQDRRRFFLNPSSVVDPLHLWYYIFSGRMIGLALMHKIQVGVSLDLTLFLQLAGRHISLDDIADADPPLHASCKKLLEMDPSLVDSDGLGLTFVREFEALGSRKSIELIEGGNDIAVTSKNRCKYIHLLIQDSFVNCTKNQLAHFAEGLSSIFINWQFSRVFFQSLDVEDFNQMLGGSKDTIDMNQWKAHTNYNGYRARDCQIIWFWKVLESMTVEQQTRLLFFWTAVKYLPFDGFSGLGSRLLISRASCSCDHLPTSHTCLYQLDLPAYASFDMMQSRLQIIVQEHVSSSFGEP
ncbi:hypothetical protein ACP70R_016182 [Stipagrostis hirtigluma subsp. patula]